MNLNINNEVDPVNELQEVGAIVSDFMKVCRATYRDGRPETDGEHTLHVMFLGVVYTAKYHPEFDPAEVALLLMVHDLDEVYVGDVNSLTADDKMMEGKEAAEATSRDSLRQSFKRHPYVLDLLERYWAQVEPVARYARGLEKIDPSFAHLRDDGQAIRAMGIVDVEEFSRLDQRAINRMADYATSDIVEMRRILGRQVADIAFPRVY